jgi:prepilin-type processing-associated H-X9-DG protein
MVELLAVVGIIGLLALLVVPAIGNSRVAAWQAGCASNLRQIGGAVALFAADNDGNLPETTHSTGARLERAWVYTLAHYLNDMDTVRICPADPLAKQRLAADGTSYTLNSYLFVQQFDPFGRPVGQSYNNVKRIPRPERTPLAFNVADRAGVGVSSDHTHSERWTNWKSVCADIQPDRFAAGNRRADQSSGSSNVLFADGHVEAWLAATFMERIQRGENPAFPKE